MFLSIIRTVSLSACLAVLAVIGGATAQPGPGYGPPLPGPIYPYSPNYEAPYSSYVPAYPPSYAPEYPPPAGYSAYPPAPDLDGPYATEGFQQFGSSTVPSFQSNSSSNNSFSRLDNSGRSPFSNSGGVAPRPCRNYGFYGRNC